MSEIDRDGVRDRERQCERIDRYLILVGKMIDR